MKKLMMLLLTVLLAGLFANDLDAIGGKITNPASPDQESKVYTWHTYGGSAYANYSTVYERAMLVNANDFGFDYPVNFGGVQSYLSDAGITSRYRIYAKDGVTLLWEKEFTTTKVGYEVVQPAAPIVLNDDFFLVHVPFLPGDGKGYPRIVLSVDGTPDHGFYGYAGTWIPRDPYQYMMYAALEQYTGPDINPPSVRGISGGDAFMDYDANIVLAVTDESSISTITGAYTVNGGVDWINVELTAAKANHYEFTGTIPAQADGGVGEVVFFVSDNLGQETTSVPFPLSWSIDNPIYSQGFEGNFPPVGWSTDYTGDGFIRVSDSDPIIKQVHSGKYSAAHLYVAEDQDDWLISPLISIPATNSSTLTFWQNNVYTSWYELHEVAVSTDMVNWTQIYEETPTVDNVWEKIYLSLSSYLGQDIYIGFHYTGNDCDNWYIDDFEVLYDYEGPTVVDLVGNEALYPIVGAYLNNDMPLSVTVNDLSGVLSVTGHYSLDGGPFIDLPFTKAKGGDEVWTATIPAESTVMTGVINFDLVDIGGIASATTADYDIEFVLDTDGPVFNYVKGTMAFVNDPMNLEISFSDESAITSCSGFYSKDGVTWTPFVMDPAKIHDYVYVGTIPAETEEILDAQVYFGMRDVEDNVSYSDKFIVKWRDGQDLFVEDFEFGAGNWIFGGDTASNWAIVAEGEYTSADRALTESPGGNYQSDEITYAQWATPMDFTAYPGAEISFWTKFDLEDGFDYMYFEGSGDGGTTWIRLETYNGEHIGWHQEIVPMNAFCGMDNVTFRFLFESDGGYETNGMYIDDLVITTYNIDWGAPTIISDPYAPLFYQGVVGDYTDAVEVRDFSGLNLVQVNYSVDGAPQAAVAATNTSLDWYEFVIPEQAPGSLVEYSIYAQDASPQLNEATSKVYRYVAGDHMIYDSGIVSYYMPIENNAAKAVRVTVPGSDESKTVMTGKLSYILFRNYADASHISANMQVHVWDDEAGLPGTELVTPFDVTSEASSANTSAMTKVDMRAYDLTVSGDFWVGVSAPYGIVYLTMESADETGTTAFERSWTGAWDVVNSVYNWTQAPLDNWHFRAVLDGVYTGIEDESGVPMVTELHQNYPNPFNPATTINFNLAKDSKVSLVVYDVMGRKVADLVNKNMVSGSHKVSFDASNLVSGVYYYTLKAGEVNQTKKMMLIK
jgi:hypothetical protein